MSVSFPGYAEIMENGTGYYLHDPSKADKSRVFEN
jgi:hypothetical protein